MTAKSGKPNHLSAFRGFEKGGAAAPHLSVSLRKLRETPPSRPENRGGGTPISRPGRLSHCYNSSAHRLKSLFELQDVRSVATNAVKPHLNHPSILLSDGFRSLPKGRSAGTEPSRLRVCYVPRLANAAAHFVFLMDGGGTVCCFALLRNRKEGMRTWATRRCASS